MLSRRGFLKTSLGAGVALAGARLAPAADQPTRRRTIVDAQVHLWKAESPDWPWVPGVPPSASGAFHHREARADDGRRRRRSRRHRPALMARRPQRLRAGGGQAISHRFAVMGRIPPESAISHLLPKWKQQPGMLGVRLTFLRGASAWLTDGTADWFWPACEKAGLPVMFLASGRAGVLTHRGAPSAAHHDRRSHGSYLGRRAGGPDRKRDRPHGVAR